MSGKKIGDRSMKRIADAVRKVEGGNFVPPNSGFGSGGHPQPNFSVRVTKDGGDQALGLDDPYGPSAATWTYTAVSDSGNFEYGTELTPTDNCRPIGQEVSFAPEGSWATGTVDKNGDFVLRWVKECWVFGDCSTTEEGGE